MSTKALLLLILILIICLAIRFQLHGPLYTQNNYHPSEVTDSFLPWRDALVIQANRLLPETQAQLLAGMLIGVQGALEPQFKDQLIATSTIHIVVVSGQNLSMVVGFLLAFAPLFGRKKTILFSLVGIVVYSLLTGMTVPVIRAAVMATLVLAAQWWGREKQDGWILIIAGLGMLLVNPNWALSISFQLSFAATFGALIFSKTVQTWLTKLPPILRDEIAVTLAAQMFTLPIIAANFHRVSLLGSIANIFVLWTVAPIMLTGMISLVLSFIWLPLGLLASLVPNLLLSYFITTINLFSQLPWAQIEFEYWHISISIGIYLVLFGLWLKHVASGDTVTSEPAQANTHLSVKIY